MNPIPRVDANFRWLAAPLALLLAGLACARADVPTSGGIGSGGLALPSPVTIALTPPATIEPTGVLPPSATLEPAATALPLEPLASPTFPPTPTVGLTAQSESILYLSQSGDTPLAVAIRFGVVPEDLVADGAQLPEPGRLIDPGTRLIIPRRLESTGPGEKLLPDSEVVFSPNAAEFDVSAFSGEQGGYLDRYQEYVGSRLLRGPEIVAAVARDNAVNPRLLLALLEYESGWVRRADRPSGNDAKYPLGHVSPDTQGLFRQLTWAANELGNGYYGWRAGTMTTARLADGSEVRLAPDLNAGTVALQHYFALNRQPADWTQAIGPDGLIAAFESFFGDPVDYEYLIYEPGVVQPPLILPFLPGHAWAYTGGPHGAWERESAWAGLDFAPPSILPGCVDSTEWIVAAAPGLVVRSGSGVVILDLDGDGREQTGWSLLYLHVADNGRVQVGDFLEEGDLIGHPSCEGGVATGTHLHLARKYNGEWVLADGPLPFVLSGWEAQAGSKPYQGALVKDGEQVLACTCASKETQIRR
jgi:LasA protease